MAEIGLEVWGVFGEDLYLQDEDEIDLCICVVVDDYSCAGAGSAGEFFACGE